MARSTIALFGLIFLFSGGCTPHDNAFMDGDAPFLKTNASWVDSLLHRMTLEEKVGQLLFAHSSYYHPQKREDLLQWSENGKIGGFLQSNIPSAEFITLINDAQELSKAPLFIGTNQPVSITNHFSDKANYPAPASLTAISNDSIRSFLADEWVHQLKSFGINLFFGPNVDKPKPLDPAYAPDHGEVEDPFFTQSLEKRLQNLRQQNIFAVGLPFEEIPYLSTPDSMVVVKDSGNILKSMVTKGLPGIMAAPTIFSHPIVKELPSFYLQTYLQQSYHFGGLIFSQLSNPDSLEAILFAGTDILVVDQKIDKTHQKLVELVKTGIIAQKILDQKVRKILLAKAWTGASPTSKNKPAPAAQRYITSVNHSYFSKKLFEASVTLANNPEEVIPIHHTNQEFQFIEAGKVTPDFKSFLAKFSPLESTRISTEEEFDQLVLKNQRTIISINNENLSLARHTKLIRQINQLGKKKLVVVVNFGTPFNLSYFDPSVVMIQAYEDAVPAQRFAAQLIFGGVQASGKLPLALADFMPRGKSFSNKVIRMNFNASPEDLGIYAHKLVAIDAIVQNAINKKAIPGCQVLVAKSGQVVYQKSFGYHTYDQRKPVQSSDLYDIASITKIAATTLAIMKLYEQQKFSLNHRIGSYLDIPEESPVHNILIRDLLTHESGLQANLPIWKHLMNYTRNISDSLPNFSNKKDINYGVVVADSLFFRTGLSDTIIKDVYGYELDRYRKVRYSDVNFFLLQQLIETISGLSLDTYLAKNFYEPLGTRHLSFNPLNQYKKDQIVPTEYDNWWRQQLLHGYVHDEAAALLGGVAGNAGLFANAESLAVLFQLFLNNGQYAGKTYLKPKTIQTFTTPIKKIKRGLGFDALKVGGYIKNGIFQFNEVFGHTGFTGTCVWVDPDEDLLYIFLSNRVYPSANNNLLNELKVRSRIQSAIYRAIAPNNYRSGANKLLARFSGFRGIMLDDFGNEIGIISDNSIYSHVN